MPPTPTNPNDAISAAILQRLPDLLTTVLKRMNIDEVTVNNGTIGNIAINNCFNARAIHAAVGAADGMMNVPTLDYLTPARFGSVELKRRDNPEFIGQAYGAARASIPAMRLDALKLERIDLIKIDVEGMELDVLEGARTSIDRYHPILTVETIKTDFDRLTNLLAELDYQVFQLDRINIAAIHRSDKTASHIKSA